MPDKIFLLVCTLNRLIQLKFNENVILQRNLLKHQAIVILVEANWINLFEWKMRDFMRFILFYFYFPVYLFVHLFVLSYFFYSSHFKMAFRKKREKTKPIWFYPLHVHCSIENKEKAAHQSSVVQFNWIFIKTKKKEIESDWLMPYYCCWPIARSIHVKCSIVAAKCRETKPFTSQRRIMTIHLFDACLVECSWFKWTMFVCACVHASAMDLRFQVPIECDRVQHTIPFSNK